MTRTARWLAAGLAAVTATAGIAAALAVIPSAGASTPAAAAPAHQLTGYWQNFDNGAKDLRLRDVDKQYDIVVVAFADALASPAGAVGFTLDPTLSSNLGGYSTADFKADIKSLHSQGRKVVLSAGGEKGNVAITSSAAAGNFASSVSGLMSDYGFDGIDIDLENGLNADLLGSAIKQIGATAGSGFVLTMAPQTIDVQGSGGSYMQLITKVRDLVTVVHTQYYNSGGMLGCDGKVYTQGSVDFITAQACILLESGLRADQVSLGLPASTRGAGSGYVSPDVVNNAVDCLTQKKNCGSFTPSKTYPGLSGVMTWSINWDASNNYAFANTVRPHLASLPGGSAPAPDPQPSPTKPAPQPSPTAAPVPSPGGSCNGTSGWSAGIAYTGGMKVAYSGHVWSARWWTQGETPTTGGSGVWKDEGACSGGGNPNPVPSPTKPAPQPSSPQPSPTGGGGSCSGAPAYSSGAVYTGGMKAAYNGHVWSARWWTQGETPTAGGSGVWKDEGAC
ncbi:MAG: glycoside hydrolase family 18 [Actinomycetia bacterium]|nr:glycoside hydrolase family 18 [Actinomycetes bacterium]MDQ1656116.1 hypothetical protein [Cryptosporangiaceae bacterium]